MNATVLAHIDACSLEPADMTYTLRITFISVRGRKPQTVQTIRLTTGRLHDWDQTPREFSLRIPKVCDFRVIEYEPLTADPAYLVGWDKDTITPDLEGNALARRAAWLKQAIATAPGDTAEEGSE